MTLLIGQETEAAGATTSPVTEIAHTFKYKALHTGKVEVLHVKFNESGTGTKGRIAIQADEAGKPKEGVLGEGEITAVTAGEHEAAITAVEVIEGTEYWLTFEPLGGTLKYKAGSTTARRIANTKHTKISELTAAQWEAEVAKGPVSVWGTGTEGGGTTAVAGTAKVKLADVAAVLTANTVTASTKAKLAGSLTALSVNTVGAITKVKVADSLKALTVYTAAGTTKLRFQAPLTALTANTVTGSTKVRFVAAAEVSSANTLKVAGITTVQFKASAAAKTANAVAATTKARFVPAIRVSVTATVKGSVTVSLVPSVRVAPAVVVSVIYAGLVNPTQRSGNVTPTSMAGLSNPRPGRLITTGLRPAVGLQPKPGLQPGGDVVVAD